MQKVAVGDIEISCEARGEGRPLILIQGLTATLDWWDASFLDKLARDYRVIIFDNRGAGRTAAPEGEFSIEQLADDTAGLMDALEIEKAFILGYSMGGMIAQGLAISHPEKVEKLVLCATFCGGSNSTFATQEVLGKLVDRSGTIDDLMNRFLGLMFDADWIKENSHLLEDFKRRYLLAPTSAHNATRQFMATATFDAYDRLKDVNIPTMVVCGSEDIIIPADNSRVIADAIQGASLLEYPGCGHGFLWQREEEFLEELQGFLG